MASNSRKARTDNFSCSTILVARMENAALYESARTGNISVAAKENLRPDPFSRQQNVADRNRTHMFQSVRTHWQLNSCLLAVVRCTNLVSCVVRLCLSSKM